MLAPEIVISAIAAAAASGSPMPADLREGKALLDEAL